MLVSGTATGTISWTHMAEMRCIIACLCSNKFYEEHFSRWYCRGVKVSFLTLAACQALCWIWSIPMYMYGKRIRAFVSRRFAYLLTLVILRSPAIRVQASLKSMLAMFFLGCQCYCQCEISSLLKQTNLKSISILSQCSESRLQMTRRHPTEIQSRAHWQRPCYPWAQCWVQVWKCVSVRSLDLVPRHFRNRLSQHLSV